VITERLPLTHVAVRYRGEVYSLPEPNRHFHVIYLISSKFGGIYIDARDDDQGFLDSSGRFLNRKQALVSAQVNNQLLKDRPIIGGRLYSENLW
jgi:hypothetical protein